MVMTVPHRIVIAPSGFKESLDTVEVATAIANGIRQALPAARIDTVPLVDGGEGSAVSLATATGGSVVEVDVTGPTGRQIRSHFALLGGTGRPTAVVEMAAAAGLSLVPRDLRDPGATTTYGVGELIRAALDAGVERILIGCGDSGTCDGGVGALQALGARALDASGDEIGRGGNSLIDVETLDLSGLDVRLGEVEISVACNPFNVLLGDSGVARVFGPQKGADPDQVNHLAAGLENWASVLDRDGVQAPGYDFGQGIGTGASGGLGAGLAGGLGATLLPRFDVMLSHVDLDGLIAAADLVITAEGAVDFQTPKGKIPAEVARRAKLHGKPVFALAGSIGGGARDVHGVGIDAYSSILSVPMPLDEAISAGGELLTAAAEQAMRLIMVGCSIASDNTPPSPVPAGGSMTFRVEAPETVPMPILELL